MSILNHLVNSLLVATTMVIGVKIFLVLVKRKPGPLPPGPKGLPLLGNIADFPSPGQPEWEHWLKHKDIYGPISSVTLLGKTLVILHSPELAYELFEKRSSKYSTRPKLTFAEFCGLDAVAGVTPYNSKLRLSRKFMHVTMGTPKLANRYLHVQEKEVHRFLFRVLQKPELFMDHLRLEASAIILKIVYGYTVEPHKPDPLIQLVNEAMAIFSAAIPLGAWFVDTIPTLLYTPEWMPGAGWKKTGKRWRATVTAAVEKPLQFTRKQQAGRNFEASMASDFYDNRSEPISAELEDGLRSAAASTYFGGADTTVNTLSVFFYQMVLAPDIQRKAQEEIDRVIGTDRLPVYSDREKLPYVSAIVTETHRWQPIVPLGVPHAAEADDFVEGYYIPQGTTVVPNVWWFTHDPAVYSNPSEFNPSRYLGPNPDPDPTQHIFGYGRRICPGRHLAVTSTWLTIAQSLAVFNIGKGLDESGREIEEAAKFTPGIVLRVEPFKATIKPRSPQHAALIRQVEELYPWEKSNAEDLEGTTA
ncbi:cytochrome protein [Xylaria palmicola]|nr:cytochrome protein [Xylaria palmicola]